MFFSFFKKNKTIVRRDGIVEAASGGNEHKPVAEREVKLHPGVYYALRFALDRDAQTFSLSVIDAHQQNGEPLPLATSVPFIANQSEPLTHVGLLELDGNDGAVVCVYQPQAFREEPQPVQHKPAPGLAFGGADGAKGGAPASAAPRTKCCGSECTCCILNHVKWDVLEYFSERYGLDVSKCAQHNDVRHTFCRSAHRGFSCDHLIHGGECLFPCRVQEIGGDANAGAGDPIDEINDLEIDKLFQKKKKKKKKRTMMA